MATVVVVVAAFVLAPIVGVLFLLGAPWLALPICAAALLVLGAMEILRRRRRASDLQRHRANAQAQKTEFSERDRETLEDTGPYSIRHR